MRPHCFRLCSGLRLWLSTLRMPATTRPARSTFPIHGRARPRKARAFAAGYMKITNNGTTTRSARERSRTFIQNSRSMR